MTVRILTLKGDPQSGKTTLALQMLEYAQLAGQSVAYFSATKERAVFLQRLTETSVPCFSPRHQNLVLSRFNMVVLDDFKDYEKFELTDFFETLKSSMSIRPFAQIILID
jgi:RecA/RadA recombinase